MNALGKHLLVEYYDCDTEVLNSTARVEQSMLDAAESCGATIVRSVFHAFNPIGVSGVVVISESHLAIHTWPEHRYAAVDVFTCGDEVQPQEAEARLRKLLGAATVVLREVPRGTLMPDGQRLSTEVHASETGGNVLRLVANDA